jgi:sugar/nucleoside kinase (ribokinase family)
MPMTSQYDVLAIGNAIVDLIAPADDELLARENVAKGGMMLIDEERAKHFFEMMGEATITSGGSAANTVVGIASLGGRGAFIGKVKEDQLGAHFTHDIRESGVAFHTSPAVGGTTTACCYIFVTPDGERTMNTFLGACQDLSESDIGENEVAAAKIVYLEGYLWDPPAAKAAFRKAAGIAHRHGNKVALTLSDRFCVDRYRAEFVELIKSRTVDIVFANESEVMALYETQDLSAALAALHQDAELAAVTRSEKGSVVLSATGVVEVPASRIDKLVDTTGAGDLFAAGFLHGYARGAEHAVSARLGSLAAGHVIQKIGARPSVSLKALATVNGLVV